MLYPLYTTDKLVKQVYHKKKYIYYIIYEIFIKVARQGKRQRYAHFIMARIGVISIFSYFFFSLS